LLIPPDGVGAYVRPVEEGDDLPEAYVTLLDLRARGASDDEVALALDVPVEAVPLLDEVARRKAAHRLGAPDF
jgi:hypothetical protein